jgi:hypothetical protein
MDEMQSSRASLTNLKLSTALVAKQHEAAKENNLNLKFLCRMPYPGMGLMISVEMIQAMLNYGVMHFPPSSTATYHPLSASASNPFEYGYLEFATEVNSNEEGEEEEGEGKKKGKNK